MLPARRPAVRAPAPPPFRLTFPLPAVLRLIAPGRHQPSADGCQLAIERSGLVHVTGPTRTQIFEHAARFLRAAGKGRGPIAITATLTSPPGYWGEGHGGRDSWAIVVGAEVSFAHTSLPAQIPLESR